MKRVPQAVILMGVQASGKSTFYAEHFSRTHLRINLDMLRTRNREKRILEACLEAGQSFVIDNTNPTRADRARYFGPARGHGFRVSGFFLQSRIADALARNAGREGNARIPDVAVKGTHNRMEMPSLAEGFDDLSYVEIAREGRFVITPWRDEV